MYCYHKTKDTEKSKIDISQIIFNSMPMHPRISAIVFTNMPI